MSATIHALPMDDLETVALALVLRELPQLLQSGGIPEELQLEAASANAHSFAALLERSEHLTRVAAWLRSLEREAAFVLRGTRNMLFTSHGALAIMANDSEPPWAGSVWGIYCPVDTPALYNRDEMRQRLAKRWQCPFCGSLTSHREGRREHCSTCGADVGSAFTPGRHDA